MQFNIIGAGAVGKNIALALHHAKIATLSALCNRSIASAQRAMNALDIPCILCDIPHLPFADITWITTADDAISQVVEALAQHAVLKPGSMVIHCSGVLNTELLQPLQEQGCFIASIHPLKAFKKTDLSDEAFNQVHCVLEGDEFACSWIKSAFTQLGASIIPIAPAAKVIYHAAASIASNYLITLAACSEALMLEAGITKSRAQQMIQHLMQGNINNLQKTHNSAEALTGPLLRGDLGTLALHLNAIKNPLIHHLYTATGLATVPLTSLSNEKKQAIRDLLECG